jgi:phospholipase C
MPPNVQLALAQGLPSRGSLRDIEHVVVLMQENSSFDHYYGTLAGVRGFRDAERQKLANGRSVLFQPDAVNPDGFTLPFGSEVFLFEVAVCPSDLRQQVGQGRRLPIRQPA